MEINNNPAINLVPLILGENKAIKPASARPGEVGNIAQGSLAPVVKKPGSLAQQAQKQAATKDYENNLFRQGEPGVSREQLSGKGNKAINAYLDNEQAEKRDFLSDALGIDVYT